MPRFLAERTGTLNKVFTHIAELDAENTDNLHAVVVQYMHENGVTFDILSEDADSISIIDEDGTFTNFAIVESPADRSWSFSKEQLDYDFMLQCQATQDDIEELYY